MKKRVSIILSIIMVFAMLAALSGCSNEQEKFWGTWKGSLDMTDYFNEAFSQDEEMGEYLKISDFTLVLELTFNKDGTYKMTVNEDAARETLESVQKDFVDGINRYFEDYIAAAGLNMSVDELVSASGINVDDLVKESFSEEMINDMIDEASSEGKFEVKGEKLFMSDGLDTNVDKTKYETYEMSGDQLTILEAVGLDNDDTGFDLYPMTLKKVS